MPPSSKAKQHLSEIDPVIARIIECVGECALEVYPDCTPFEALARAIAYQQLTARAAESIVTRLQALFVGKSFPLPEDILATEDHMLRSAGFSRAKVDALRDLALKALQGVVPSPSEIVKMDDEDVVARVIQIRGIGRWTAEMLLIFGLGRPDVFPVSDYGIRTGLRLAFNLPDLPKHPQTAALGERWRPYRTTAAWYLWREVERVRAGTSRLKKR